MQVDVQTQEFLNQYVPLNQKVYTPPIVEDAEGDQAIFEHMQQIKNEESKLLSKLSGSLFN